MKPQVIFLGTGSAFPQNSYNSCFILEDETLRLLIDAGGGNGILYQLKCSNIPIQTIHHFFISHSHTDHILGAVWVVRAIINSHLKKDYSGFLHIYGNAETLPAFDTICKLTLLTSHYDLMCKLVIMHDVDKIPAQDIQGFNFRFFDVGSENVCQSGFDVKLSNGKRFVCLGDEAMTSLNERECLHADYVVCGAFCRHADADVFQPYEKHHHTVLDVARVANNVHVKNLIIVHCEDSYLNNMQELYRSEARLIFPGNLIVPKDLEKIYL